MKSERIMEEEICAELEYLKFRSVTEEKAKMLYEEYDMRYRRALETRRGDPVYFYTLREACGIYLKEVYKATEWLVIAGYRV